MPVPGVLRLMSGVLLEAWRARGRRPQVLGAALNHATAVGTWQSLVQQQGLADDEAIELLVAMVLAAARKTAVQPSLVEQA